MNDEKVFCGNGKAITTQYGELLKLSFSKEDIQTLVEQSEKSESGWVNVNVKKRREASERGTTHYLEVDTWKPTNGGGNNASSSAPKKSDEAELTAEDLPF